VTQLGFAAEAQAKINKYSNELAIEALEWITDMTANS